ncbi:MAG: class I SAM-dependent methyltransferase [Mariprofundaceae bacterium]
MRSYFEKTKLIRGKYIQYFHKGSKVIDIGCGDGAFVRMMAESGFDAYGVDSNPMSVEAAQSNNLKVSLGDAVAFLKQHEKQFDGIICSHMIEHVSADDVGELIQACRHALTEDGSLLVITPNIHTLTGHSDFWNDPTHIKPYTEDALKKLFRFNGLETTSVGYDQHSQIPLRKSLSRYPLDLLRQLVGVFIYGAPAKYNELYAVGRKSA